MSRPALTPEAAIAAPRARPSRDLISPRWQRRLFILPAVLVTLAVVVFPTLFGLYVSFTDWQRTDQSGRIFNGLDNFRQLFRDDAFWNALQNNFTFVLIGVPIQYVIALGLALLLNQDIKGRRIFRVIFLLPFMMSPIAAGYMVGRLMFEARIGPVVDFLERLGIQYSFFETGPRAVALLIMVDAWVSIPFILVMLLAGLQALPGEVFEAARIDGASRWQLFWDMTFPLLLPVSLTAVLLRVIFEFKIVDIIQVVTGGGPGSASETVTYYVYNEGYLGGNIGYATAMAQVFLVIIIAFVAVLLVTVGRRVRDVT